jgi:hypothetical protein
MQENWGKSFAHCLLVSVQCTEQAPMAYGRPAQHFFVVRAASAKFGLCAINMKFNT